MNRPAFARDSNLHEKVGQCQGQLTTRGHQVSIAVDCGHASIRSFKDAIFARVGRSLEHLVGASLRELMPEEATAARRRVVEEVVRTGRPVRFQDRLHDRYIDYHAHPVFDGEGRVARLAVLGVDLTERRQAEETLRLRLAELEALHTVSAALRTAETRDEALAILLEETLGALNIDADTV